MLATVASTSTLGLGRRTPRRRSGLGRGALGDGPFYWEMQGDGGADALRALDAEPAAVRLDDTLHDGEAETGAARTRGVKRIEGASTHVGCHAVPFVLDFDAHGRLA